MFAVGILLSPVFFRVARSSALSVARSEYVEAATLSGASTAWVMRKHFLAKVVPPLSISISTTLGTGLVVIASLTFLGIGVQPPTATWGGILASDLQYIAVQPLAPIVPVAVILAAVLGCNLLADAVRDVSGEAGRQLLNGRAAGKAGRVTLASRARIGIGKGGELG
jgi:peptide/nickel transport system permease protein